MPPSSPIPDIRNVAGGYPVLIGGLGVAHRRCANGPNIIFRKDGLPVTLANLIAAALDRLTRIFYLQPPAQMGRVAAFLVIAGMHAVHLAFRGRAFEKPERGPVGAKEVSRPFSADAKFPVAIRQDSACPLPSTPPVQPE